jgi:hypothetical protein
MGRQDFNTMVESGLLAEVEKIVVEAHRDLYLAQGREWSRPIAYRWLRYEDPVPVTRLAEGVRKLRRRRGRFDAQAVEKACVKGSQKGFLN